MPSSRDRPAHSSQKAGLLRIFKAAAAVARYCARNAGRLILLVSIPCAMVAVCQIALDWLSVSFPPKLPAWLLSPQFNPPTWLTALAQTPWGAMAWASVLSGMSNRSPPGAGMRRRLALSVAVLVAAVIFSALNLIDGGLRALQLQLLASIYTSFEPSDELLNALGRTGEIVQVIVMAAVVAGSYLAIGRLLQAGFKGMAGVWSLTRDNRLRVFALFLLLIVAESALNLAAAPAVSWVVRSFADELFWTFKGALIRQLLDLPFFMLWTVVYAVTVGIVLGALEQRAAPQAAARPMQGRATAAVAPPPRPDGSRPW
jgi:hypothetical protein